MAEPLEREIRFDLAPALASLQDLDSQFESLFARVEAGLSSAVQSGIQGGLGEIDTPELDVDADVSDAQAEIDSLAGEALDVPVSADTSDAEGEVDALVADAEAQEIAIPVSVETGDAEAQISGLQETAEEGAGGLEQLGAAGLNVGARLSSAGNASGFLGGKLSGAALGAGVATAGVAVLGKQLSDLVVRGADVLEVTQQFDNTFGRFASRVRTVDVAGLNTSLEDLSISLGTDDEALLAATARAGAYAKTLGLTGEETAKFGEEVVALGAFVSSVNPSLGTIDQVTAQIARTLARSPTGLGRLGLDVDPQRIEELAQALGKTTGELSKGELAALAAQSALEGVGDVSDDVAKRQGNAGVILRGTTERFQDLLEEIAVPVAVPVLEALEEFAPVISSLAPLAKVFGEALGFAIRQGIQLLTPFTSLLGSVIAGVGDLVEQANKVPGLGRIVPDDLGDDLKNFGVGLEEASQRANEAARAGAAVATATDDAGEAADGATGALEAYAAGQEAAAEATAAAQKELDDFVSTAVGALPQLEEALSGFNSGVSTAFGDLVSVQDAAREANDRAGEAVVAAREKLAEAQRAASEAGPNQADAAAARIADAAAAVDEALGTVVTTASEGEADITAAQDRLAQAADPQRFIDNLAVQTLAIASFTQNLQALLDAGLTNLARFIAEQGPAAGAALAQSFVNDPALAQAAEDTVAGFKTVSTEAAAFMENEAGPATAAGYAKGLASDASKLLVKRAAEGLVRIAKDGVDVIAEIRSPSALFARSGEQMAAGLAVGLRRTDDVVAAAEELARAAVPSLALAATAADVAGVGAAAATGTGSGNVIVQGPLVGSVPRDVDPMLIGAELAFRISS